MPFGTGPGRNDAASRPSIDLTPEGGTARAHELSAMVELEITDAPGCHPTADAASLVEHPHPQARLGKVACRSCAGHARAENRDDPTLVQVPTPLRRTAKPAVLQHR